MLITEGDLDLPLDQTFVPKSYEQFWSSRIWSLYNNISQMTAYLKNLLAV
jgi:hypothetical protein